MAESEGAFQVVGDRRCVEAWSQARLQYEPRSPGLRAALRKALAELEPAGVLRCEFLSGDPSSCDVENVLIYNVSTAAFHGLDRAGLVFERGYQLPGLAPAGPMSHAYRYETRASAEFAHWGVASMVASWQCTRPRDGGKPAGWWHRTVRSARRESGAIEVGAPFGLRIRVGPARGSIVNALKPMLDGCISAFHRDQAPAGVPVERLASWLHVPAPEVAELLREGSGVLGERTLVRPFREGLQWYPADDLCVACAVIFEADLGPGEVVGQLLAVRSVEAAVAPALGPRSGVNGGA